MKNTQTIIARILTDKQQTLAMEVLPQSELLQVLIAIQNELGYIPKNSISALAEVFNISRADVHGVVTFYDDLKLRDEAPVSAKHVLKICQAEACQSMGVRAIMRQLKERYPLDNERVRIEHVYCLGNCALAPSILLDGQPHGNVTFDHINDLIG